MSYISLTQMTKNYINTNIVWIYSIAQNVYVE